MTPALRAGARLLCVHRLLRARCHGDCRGRFGGGELSFNLSHREVTAPERAFPDAQGRVSAAATMRAMARAQDARTALVEIKAVDALEGLQSAIRKT